MRCAESDKPACIHAGCPHPPVSTQTTTNRGVEAPVGMHFVAIRIRHRWRRRHARAAIQYIGGNVQYEVMRPRQSHERSVALAASPARDGRGHSCRSVRPAPNGRYMSHVEFNRSVGMDITSLSNDRHAVKVEKLRHVEWQATAVVAENHEGVPVFLLGDVLEAGGRIGLHPSIPVTDQPGICFFDVCWHLVGRCRVNDLNDAWHGRSSRARRH